MNDYRFTSRCGFNTTRYAEGLGNLKPVFRGDEVVLRVFANRLDGSSVREKPFCGLRIGFQKKNVFVYAGVAASETVRLNPLVERRRQAKRKLSIREEPLD